MAIKRKSTRSFPFLQLNEREQKPRKHGLTEIRGPYYSVVGRRYLEDLFETMGAYVDSQVCRRFVYAHAGARSARYHRTLS
jgi:hypothetical protein